MTGLPLQRLCKISKTEHVRVLMRVFYKNWGGGADRKSHLKLLNKRLVTSLVRMMGTVLPALKPEVGVLDVVGPGLTTPGTGLPIFNESLLDFLPSTP